MEAYGTKNSTQYITHALVNNSYDIDLEVLPPSREAELTINGYNGNRYNINLYEEISYIELINFQDGQEIKLICNNKSELPSLLVISGEDTIKWLMNALPRINKNAIISLQKQGGIIYSEIKKDYIGSAESGSDSSDNEDEVFTQEKAEGLI